jgi:hypothetical protein
MAMGLFNLDEEFYKNRQGKASNDMDALRSVVGLVGQRMADKRGLNDQTQQPVPEPARQSLNNQTPQLIQAQQNRMVPVEERLVDPLQVMNPGSTTVTDMPRNLDMNQQLKLASDANNGLRDDIFRTQPSGAQDATTMYNAGQTSAPIYELDTSGIPDSPFRDPVNAQKLKDEVEAREKQEPGFIQKMMADPNFFPQMAISFNTLRLRPDAGLNTAMQKQIDFNNTTKTANRTANYFTNLGTPAGDRAASWIMSGGDPKEAMSVYKSESLKSNTDSFAEYPDLQSAVANGTITPADAFTIINNRKSLEQQIASSDKGMEETLTPEKYLEYYGSPMPEYLADKIVQRNSKTGDLSVVGSSGVTTNVSMGEKFDVEQQKQTMKFAFDQVSETRTQNRDVVNAQRSTQQALRRMSPLLEDFANMAIGSPQFNNFVTGLSKQFETLGLDTGMARNITTADQFTAALTTLVQEQLRLNKGPQTDFDAIFASQTLPSLSNSLEANKAIVDYLDSQAEWTLIKESVNKQAYKMAVSNPTKAAEIIFEVDEYFNSVPAIMTLPNGRNQTLSEFKKEARKAEPNASDLDIIHYWKQQEAEVRGQDYNAVPHPKDVMGL